MRAPPAPTAPQLRPALPQNAPPPDIGPAGGQLPPIIPLTTREEQEREARMLAEIAERGLAQVRGRRRDLEDHLQRDRRSVEAIAAELAEAAAAKPTGPAPAT